MVIPLLLLAGLPACTLARAAEAPDSIEAVRSLVQAGALQLALRRIDALQSRDAAAASPKEASSAGAPWEEWETLRLHLLMRLNRNDEVLQRVGVLPASLPAVAGTGLHVIAAQAAFALGRTAVARDHAGRALWTTGLDAGVLRELRLLVIRSLTRERRNDDAWRSMLRFEQDYRPLDRATATVFVDALLDLGMVREAVIWLNPLDERGPAKLRLRLHTGVITPQEAVTQANAALGRSEDPAWWRVLREAADRQNSGALSIAAREQLLDVKDRLIDGLDAEANGLWDAYVNHARIAANSHQLLAGDDAGWLEFALRRRAVEPAEARAYLAYLTRYSRDAGIRQSAQEELAADFTAAKLPRTGLRVFDVWPVEAGALTPATRHKLGAMAETAGGHVRALQYWQGLPAPDGMPAAVWSLRLSALALRAGRADVAIDIVRSLAAERSAIPVVQLPAWITLAQQFTDHGLYDAARALFERVLPYADATQARLVLSGIAKTHERPGQSLQAAEFYLHSATRAPKEVPLGGAPGLHTATDAKTTEARLLAGFSLARAGLHDDAKAQFEWIMKNASDPEQIAIARRELGF
jgi:hypothetical protein